MKPDGEKQENKNQQKGFKTQGKRNMGRKGQNEQQWHKRKGIEIHNKFDTLQGKEDKELVKDKEGETT